MPYYWKSTGNDSLCDSLEGNHPYKPQRPHIGCICDLAYVPSMSTDLDEVFKQNGAGKGCFEVVVTSKSMEVQSSPEEESGWVDAEVTAVIEGRCVDYEGSPTQGESKTFNETIQIFQDSESDNYTNDGLAGFYFNDWVKEKMAEVITEFDGKCPPCSPPKLT